MLIERILSICFGQDLALFFLFLLLLFYFDTVGLRLKFNFFIGERCKHV